MNCSRLVKKDLKTVWHPCTQMKDHEKIPMIPIKSGKGVWLYDYDDNKYLDAISSWWDHRNLFVIFHLCTRMPHSF
jgi:adenosylmethionine-8-amino-7-oxononanoate aminotransferase